MSSVTIFQSISFIGDYVIVIRQFTVEKKENIGIILQNSTFMRHKATNIQPSNFVAVVEDLGDFQGR